MPSNWNQSRSPVRVARAFFACSSSALLPRTIVEFPLKSTQCDSWDCETSCSNERRAIGEVGEVGGVGSTGGTGSTGKGVTAGAAGNACTGAIGGSGDSAGAAGAGGAVRATAAGGVGGRGGIGGAGGTSSNMGAGSSPRGNASRCSALAVINHPRHRNPTSNPAAHASLEGTCSYFPFPSNL